MKNEFDPIHATESKPLDRRTLLKASAWAAPVVAIAVTAPAAAASAGRVANIQTLGGGIGDGNRVEARLTDANGVGVDGVTVTVTVVSGPLAPSVATAVSEDEGYFFLPQLSTLTAGQPNEVAYVQISAGSVSQTFQVTVSPN